MLVNPEDMVTILHRHLKHISTYIAIDLSVDLLIMKQKKYVKAYHEEKTDDDS